MYLMIKNEGEIELEALTLMGATSKEGDESKIGFFGSGNKYALATLMRHDIGVRIFSGTKEYKVTSENVTFRGAMYQRILVNDLPTSLTTRMGPAWEPWMAVRELYSNAKDEGLMFFGPVSEIQEPMDGQTAIYITITPDIQNMLDHLGNYFIQEEAIDTLNTVYGQVSILDNPEGRRYRKGIACANDTMKSCYSYDFDNITINESRIIEYDYTQYEQIACALAKTTDPEIISTVIPHLNDDTYLESRARWEPNFCKDNLSHTWSEVLIALGTPIISKSLADYLGAEETMNTLSLPDTLVQKIKEELPTVPMYGSFDGQSIAATPSEELKEAVETALTEIESWGIKKPTVQYRKFIRSDIIAQCYQEQIYVSISCPINNDLISMLYEEITHLHTGLNDCTRSMQSHLFSEIVRLQRRIHRSEN